MPKPKAPSPRKGRASRVPSAGGARPYSKGKRDPWPKQTGGGPRPAGRPAGKPGPKSTPAKDERASRSEDDRGRDVRRVGKPAERRDARPPRDGKPAERRDGRPPRDGKPADPKNTKAPRTAKPAAPRPAPRTRKIPKALREPREGAKGAGATKGLGLGGTASPRASTGPTRSGTVAIVGRPNVGKSTLLNAALEVELAVVTPTPQTTRETLLGVVHREVDDMSCELALLDTPGLHKAERALDRRMNRAARDAAEEASVVVFVADASGALEHSTVHPGDVALLADIGANSRAILALNKVDRVKDKAKLLPMLEAYSAVRTWDAIVPMSARKTDGVDRLLDEVARLLPEGPHRFGEDDLTDRPARFFVKEYVREQILLLARQEVPHAAAVNVEAFEEGSERRVTRVAATIHVEREGQKKILVGTGGAMLKQIGTEARMRLQEIVGFQVHLELFVRVTPGWRDAPTLLEELGIGSDGETQ